MRNWIDYVSQHLALPELKRDREARIVEELARQLEDFYDEARSCGASDEEAEEYARQQITDWEGFAAELLRAERANTRPKLEEWHERAEEAAMRKGGRWRMFADMRRDLLYAIRMLLRNRGFTFVAVLTLALGIGANTAIFSVVNAVLLRPLSFKESDRLFQLWGQKPQRLQLRASYQNFLDWREQSHSFEYMAAYRSWNAIYAGKDQPELLNGVTATASLFPLLGEQPFLGRVFSPAEDQHGALPVVILSYHIWQRIFAGDPGVIGRSISLNSNKFTVIGVMSANFPLTQDIWVPIPFDPIFADRDSFGHLVMARLKPQVTLEQAQAEMDTIASRLEQQYPEVNTGRRIHIISLHEQVIGDVRPALLVFLTAVGFVLLIACANVANLLFARASARYREIAIRAALGASRLRVIRQMLTESIMLSLLGGMLGLMLVFWGIDLLITSSAGAIPRANEIEVDYQVFGFALLVSIVTGVIFGVGPAWKSSRISLNETLKEGTRGTGGGLGRQHIRNLLMISEVALALVILIGAGLLVNSFLQLTSVDPGFDSRNLLTFRVNLPEAQYVEPHQVKNFFEQIEKRLARVPSIQSVGMIHRLPLGGNNGRTIIIEGRPAPAAGEELTAEYRVVSPQYFQTMKIPLRAGRALTEQDKAGNPQVILINEAMAKHYWPGEEPLGHRVHVQGAWRTIVGIVGDVKHFGLDAEVRPEIYVPDAWSAMTLVIRTAEEPTGILPSVRREIGAVDKEVPLTRVATMNQLLSQSVAPQRFNLILMTIFAVLALTLSAVGVYSVIAYSVAQRRHEIGIRLALGAQAGDILRLIIGRGMLLVLIGLTMGLTGSLALSRLIESLLFGVTTTDWMTYAAVSGILAMVALAACYLPARRATKVDPMVALRYE